MKKIIALVFALLCVFSLSLTSFAASELTALLSENYDSTLYTEESYQRYQKALNKAVKVNENDFATAEEIRQATEELKTAKNGLELILNREPLLTYVDGIDGFLHGTGYILSEDTEKILTEARKEFLTLYESNSLTAEQLSTAATKYNNVTALAEDSAVVQKFSSKDAGKDITVPTKVISSTQGLGKVTAIRLTMLWIGVGLFALGVTASVLYLKPPKFLK